MFDRQMDTSVGYAQKDPHLRKMESEAYLKGNMCFRDWEDQYKSKHKDIFYERRIRKMSTKKWKNKELSSLLNERWGFSMNLDKLNESREITHMCALHVTHKKSGKEGHPIKHTLSESGEISHYTVEFADVIVENIAVENLNILQLEKHSHKRDEEKEHDKNKSVVSEEELEMVDCGDKGRVPKYACDGKGANDLKKGGGEKQANELRIRHPQEGGAPGSENMTMAQLKKQREEEKQKKNKKAAKKPTMEQADNMKGKSQFRGQDFVKGMMSIFNDIKKSPPTNAAAVDTMTQRVLSTIAADKAARERALLDMKAMVPKDDPKSSPEGGASQAPMEEDED